jgi:hypothetical protein
MSEWALYATKVENLKHYRNEFSRIYFGNEFCQRLIPAINDLGQVLDFVSRNKLGFTFVTPYVTNDGLDILRPLFGKIAEENPGSEVVFNDWGVLRILNEGYDGLEPVMGRLLNRMKRGPRLMNFMDVLPQSSIEYFRSCSIDVPLYRKFLIRNRVRRVELDNLLQGIELNLADSGITGSLYIPYAYVTTTRFCLAVSCDVHGKEDVVGIFPCRKECQEYTFYLTHSVMPVPLIRKGNTVFFKNERVPEDMEVRNIRRIVIEPEVPL